MNQLWTHCNGNDKEKWQWFVYGPRRKLEPIENILNLTSGLQNRVSQTAILTQVWIKNLSVSKNKLFS